MPKFYLKSGTVSYIVCAVDQEGAALWAMHRTMDRMAELYEAAKAEWYDSELDQQLENRISPDEQRELGVPAAIPYDAMLEGLIQFDETIQISEMGFGHSEAGELETETIFHKWRQLMLAVDRLHNGEQRDYPQP